MRRRHRFQAHGPPIAAVFAVLLGAGLFLGIPIWLGYAAHAPIWIAAWSLVVAPMSTDGFDMIANLVQPPCEPLPISHQIARCAAVFARTGAIGIAGYAVGCLAR